MKESRALPATQSASPYSAAQWNSFRKTLDDLRCEETAGDPQYSKKFLLWFDEPLDWKQVARRWRLAGWCIAQDGRPLPSIRASIRGRTFETFLDRGRPDVVERFRLSKTVERCGFVLDLEVPRGKSRIELQAPGPEGEWRKVFARTVRGPLFASAEEQERWAEIALADAPERFDWWFDRPSDWNRPVRTLYVSGWCVDRKGERIDDIRARIGSREFSGNFGIERNDLGAIYGTDPSFTQSGFAIAVPLRPGKSELLLECKQADSGWRGFFRHEVVGAGKSDPPDEALPPQEIKYFSPGRHFDWWFDRPADWNRPVRTLYISGWCLDRKGEQIDEIRAKIGRRKFLGNYGIERIDLGAIYGENPILTRSGFAIAVPLRPGKSLVALECRQSGAGWRRIIQLPVVGARKSDPPDEPLPRAELEYFTPNPRTNSRFKFWVAGPADWSKPVRYQHLAGWCFAISGNEVSEVRARIRGKLFRAYYGIPRPDVATKYERRPGSLRSGFSVDVIVPWGRGRLVLEARSSNGPWEEFLVRKVRGTAAWLREEDVYSEIGNYPAWVRLYDTLTRSDREKIRRHIARFKRRPLFSVLLPVHNSNGRWLRRAIESVRAQLYEHWELCIVDDASSDARIWKLLQRYARRDSRIKILRRRENGHICAASNDALAFATGEFVALLDHDDELAPTALYFAAHALDFDPALQLIYSDEDKLDARERRRDPHFKPDWNPDLLTSQNYISHLGLYATALVRKIGGFRRGFEGSQDYDLTWRCVEQIDASQIHHIPRVLYHWRMTEQSAAMVADAKSYAQDAALRTVQEHLDRSGIVASVEPHRGIYLRVRYPLPEPAPLVSIIIATRDRADFLQRCLESIFSKTDYPNFEIIILDNESREPETLKYLAALRQNERVTIHRSEGAFNFSKLNNIGVALARGAFVALLNNDLEIINRSWLSEMVGHAARAGIGAVGARLWYPNGTIQHGGVILGAGGIGNHAHMGLRDEDGYFSRAHLTQNLSAVTAACLVVRKEIYTQVGGLDEINLAVAFNDVDFCLRLREAGYRIVWTPHAELFHHESASRGFEDTMEKRQRFLAEAKYVETMWGHALESDPCYNPNLSLGAKLFVLALPPRLPKPWENGSP